MGQIYSTYIRLDKNLIEYLTSIKYDKDIHPKLEQGQIKTLKSDGIRLHLIHLHILISLTKKQNHLLSKLDDNFFQSISKYKDKLIIRFDLKLKSDQQNYSDIVPLGVEYLCQSNKTSITLKKNLIKTFLGVDILIKETKRNKEYPVTQFNFEEIC